MAMLKRSKCQFFVERLELLGNVVSAKGQHLIPKYGQKVVDFRVFTCHEDVSSLLGLCSHVSRYLKNMSQRT